jgi:methionyl-tRNA formyltransferase
MLLDEGMDTGPIIAQAEYTLSGEETAETLTGALFARGSDLLMENLNTWVSGGLQLCPQDEARATVTRKLEREDGRADWMLSAIELSTRRRAYTPWPGLYTHWDGKVVKLLDVVALPREIAQEAGPGTVCVTGQVDIPLAVVTGDGLLGLKRLQIEGRNAVTGAEFLRGYPGIAGSSLV